MDSNIASCSPQVTVVIPSFNQGAFLEAAISSILSQDVPVEIFVLDGGSTDASLDVIRSYENRLAGWRSRRDEGQAAAINEGVDAGSAPYVCWLNSDDVFLDGGLTALVGKLNADPDKAWGYGGCWTVSAHGRRLLPYLTLPFWPAVFANFCCICQPGTLIRRSAWEAVGGVDPGFQMAMDYDLWWRLYHSAGTPAFVKKMVAGTRAHPDTKTATRVDDHYAESIKVVERHFGRVPLKWRLALPLMRWMRRL